MKPIARLPMGLIMIFPNQDQNQRDRITSKLITKVNSFSRILVSKKNFRRSVVTTLQNK